MARLFLTTIFVLILCLSACGDMSRTPNSTVQSAVQSTEKIQPSPTNNVSTPTTAITVTPGSSQDEEDMREALLRYRFEEVVSKQASYPDSKYYCVGLETTQQSASNLTDLPQSFLDRFKGNKTPVVKASDCAWIGDKDDSKKVVFKSSGEQAIFWGLGNVNWSSKDKAELELSFLYAFNGTGGSIFQLERQNETWVVTGYTLTWIA